VIAHRLATVRMLDRILVFDNGEVVEEDGTTICADDGRHLPAALRAAGAGIAGQERRMRSWMRMSWTRKR